MKEATTKTTNATNNSRTVVQIPVISKSNFKIMFVSNNNTCRSPMAEYIMKYLVNSAGLAKRITVMSSGLKIDEEMPMNHGAVRELHKHQIPFIKRTAVQFLQSDCETYDYVICMSQDQIKQLSRINRRNNLYLIMDFAGEHRSIMNPIPNSNYPFIYSLIYRGCEALMNHLQKCLNADKSYLSNIESLAKTSITLQVNEDLFKRFEAALVLTKDNLETAIEKSMTHYISDVAKILTGNDNANTDEKIDKNVSNSNNNVDTAQIAERFIRKWASGIGQINRIIIKSYFKSIEIDGKATVNKMRELCCNKNEYPSLYIYKPNGFENYYKQMKSSFAHDGDIDDDKSVDGKVFWESEEEVKLLNNVKPAIEKYKRYFL